MMRNLFSPPTQRTPSEPGWLYHATNVERAFEIAQHGLMTHLPDAYTEQSAWPDGSEEPRIYFSSNAGIVWTFAPEEGDPVILRVHRSAGQFRREITGDIYTVRPIRPENIQILGADQRWHPIDRLLSPELGPSTDSMLTP